MRIRTVLGAWRPSLRGTVFFVTVLLLAVSASCSTQSSEQAEPTTTQQQGEMATAAPPTTAEAPLPTTTVEEPIPTAVGEASMPADWVTYTNQRCAYAIGYPPGMEVTGDGSSGQLFSFKLDSPGRGATNFVYVSVIDQESPTLGDEIIYNYDPAESDMLLNMQIGESKALRDIADVAPWFTYERMPDTTLAGHVAQTYENAQPWEFPEGTKEIRYYLLLDGCTYMIGGYLDALGSNETGAINEELFNEIIATIQLP